MPVNVRFIEFVLVLMQIRQYYYDTVLERPAEVIKKLFPTFFLVASRFLGNRELDSILSKLELLKKNQPIGESRREGYGVLDIGKALLGEYWNKKSKL